GDDEHALLGAAEGPMQSEHAEAAALAGLARGDDDGRAAFELERCGLPVGERLLDGGGEGAEVMAQTGEVSHAHLCGILGGLCRRTWTSCARPLRPTNGGDFSSPGVRSAPAMGPRSERSSTWRGKPWTQSPTSRSQITRAPC